MDRSPDLSLEPASVDELLRAALAAFRRHEPAAMEALASQAVAAARATPALPAGRLAHALQLLGVARHLQARHEAALAALDEALVASAGQPSAELLVNRGEVLRCLMRLPEAEAAFGAALEKDAGNAEALNNLGLVQQARGRHGAAEASYRAALAARSGHAEALNNLGTLCQETRRWDEAEACYRQVLATDPHHRNALNNLATMAKEAGRPEEARAIYEAILARSPDFWRSWNSLGQLAKDAGDFERALHCYRQALGIAPDQADTLYNIALLQLLFADRPLAAGEAEATPLSRPLAGPVSDRLALGLAAYEVRYDRRSQNKSAPKPPELGCPMWQGEPLAGRHIALVREQGLGDQLQFCRFAGALRAQGAEVTLIADGPLVPLLQSLVGPDGPHRVIAPGQQHDFRYDCWAFLLSLPHHLGTDLAHIPRSGGYLPADPARRQRWQQRLDALEGTLDGALGGRLNATARRPRIGLVWGGNPEHANNRNRSMRLADLAPLLDDPALSGVRWVSVQKTAHGADPATGPAAELAASPWAGRVADVQAELQDFSDTAALLAELDLLISVDTSVVHLAGAVATPCWALLAHGPDWRWLRDRSTTPWYDSVHLLRQPTPRDWASVVLQLRAALPAWLAQGRPADVDPTGLAPSSASSPAAARSSPAPASPASAMPTPFVPAPANTEATALLHAAMAALQGQHGGDASHLEAEAACRQSLALADSLDGWHLLALALKRQQRLAEADAAYVEALARCGESAGFRATVLANHGHLQRARGDEAGAEASYREAITIRQAELALQAPASASAATSGAATVGSPRHELAELQTQLGNSLAAQGRVDAAEACWREGLAACPGHAGLLNALAAQVQKRPAAVGQMAGRLKEAEALYRQALASDPRSAPVLYNLAGVLNDSGRLEEAIATYQQALAIDPDYVNALTSLLRVQQAACVWAPVEGANTRSGPLAHAQATEQRVREVVAGQPRQAVFPFAFLATPASRAEQQRCARQWVQLQYRPQLERAARQRYMHALGPRDTAAQRLRIGYLSSDLHNHATAYLMAEVFERHDRAQVEVFAYSCGPEDGGAMRPRLKAAIEHWIDCAELTPEALAERIHADHIDILVDLKGYTRDTRSQVLALRPAPVQVNWLGYPGTLGDRFADYILGDPVVTPLAHGADYDEQIAQLPWSYQPNDRLRRIGARPERAALGLPEHAVVLCCFNHTYKITPAVFGRWVQVLQAVPDTVLWLLRSNPLAETHLRERLAAAGIAPDRLVFAAEAPLEAHLGRLQQADLVLDTEPYNAHTTSSDALWAGVPVLTRTGDTFPSRVATSLLRAAGLPELAVATGEAYVQLAIDLASDRTRLAALKQQLTRQRSHSPLFDCARFTRDLEALYRRMWARAEAGLAPAPLPAEPDATGCWTVEPRPSEHLP
ncbi:MAG: hypothetical protein RL722_1515, partial [Pseudomonadota bacterium]